MGCDEPVDGSRAGCSAGDGRDGWHAECGHDAADDAVANDAADDAGSTSTSCSVLACQHAAEFCVVSNSRFAASCQLRAVTGADLLPADRIRS